MPNDKIRYMINFVTTEVISSLMEDSERTVQEAMKAFYNSGVFERLCDVETGLYRESGGYVYDLYKTELKYGRLVRTET